MRRIGRNEQFLRREKRRGFRFGFGESQSTFVAKMIADGVPAGIANGATWSDAWQAEYNYYRSKGLPGLNAWQFSEIASLDQTAAHIALDAGVPATLLIEMRNQGLWMDEEGGRQPREYAAPKAIRNGAPPLSTIQQALGMAVTGGTGDTVTQAAKDAAIARAKTDLTAAQNDFDAAIPEWNNACQQMKAAVAAGSPVVATQYAQDSLNLAKFHMTQAQDIIDHANETIVANGGTAIPNPRKAAISATCDAPLPEPPPAQTVPPPTTTTTDTTTPTCTGTFEQCNIPATSNYWQFPDGTTGAPVNVSVTPSITLPTGQSVPVDGKTLLLVGAAGFGGLALLMMNQKQGRRR